MQRVAVSRGAYRSLVVATAIALTAASALTAHAAETVHFTIDAARNVRPISPYIYGVNQPLTGRLANATFTRLGGNRWTAYNWVNNASNAGSDFFFQNDDFLGGGDTPGGAVTPGILNAKKRGAAMLLTIPVAGYVSADKSPPGDVRDSGPNYLQTRFRVDKPVKGTPFTLTPDPNARNVYQDEFVNWVKTNYPASQTASSKAPIWFSLDNEPDLWNSTHAEIHPNAVTYAELVQKSIAFSRGIKAVAPNTLVFGPVSYGFNGYVNLQNATDANGRDWLTYYMQKMRNAAGTGGRLLDVLDLHWYPEATGGGTRITENDTSPAVVAARLQAPRSLWDTTYKETSWIADDYYNGPIYLLPRLFAKIRRAYPDTKLGFTEYNYGAGGDISGGIAQADVLGIFGRDGVFAASEFPLIDNETFIAGAFNMFRNFDGAGAAFGDTTVLAKTDNVPDTSVYASLDSSNPNRLVVVAINKTAAPITAVIRLAHAPAVAQAAIYQLTSRSALPRRIGSEPIPSRFVYRMPAYSVSTLNLTP